MDILEQVFSELIQRTYRKHDSIQFNEDKKLRNKSLELNRIDELAAYEMEKWLIKHKKN